MDTYDDSLKNGQRQNGSAPAARNGTAAPSRVKPSIASLQPLPTHVVGTTQGDGTPTPRQPWQQRPKFPGSKTFAPQNTIVNRRNEHGDHIARTYLCREPLPSIATAEDKHFDDLINLIAKSYPLKAALMKWKYYSIVRHNVALANDTLAEEWAALDSANERAVAQNALLASEIERLIAWRVQVLQPTDSLYFKLQERVAKADSEAASALARVHEPYDPTKPEAAYDRLAVAALPDVSLPSAAAMDNVLHFPVEQIVRLNGHVSTALSVITGACAGLSYGFLSGGITASRAFSDPASLLWAGFGIAPTLWAKGFVRLVGFEWGKEVSRAEAAANRDSNDREPLEPQQDERDQHDQREERKQRDRSARTWSCAAIGVGAVCVAVVTALDRSGILAYATATQDAAPTAGTMFTYTLAASFLCIGAIGFAAMEGRARGRAVMDDARAALRQERTAADRVNLAADKRKARLADQKLAPLYAKAFAAVGARLALERLIKAAESSRDGIAQSIDTKIEQLSGQFLAIHEKLAMEARQRHEDGQVTAWFSMGSLWEDVEASVYEAEGSGSLRRWLWRVLLGRRAERRRRRATGHTDH